jgi:hypothetical protein
VSEEKISGFASVEEPCDLKFTRRDLKAQKEVIAVSEAVLVMNCGARVQTIVDFTGKIVLPVLDTLFIGSPDRIGMFYDKCQACGEYILEETGGVFPIIRCLKGLLNSPCGGQVESNCEVCEYEKDCAWVLIWKILFNNPEGTYDDRFWAVAFAVYVAEQAPSLPNRTITKNI